MDEQWVRWRGYVRRYFDRRVPDPDLVDDLVQETCYRALVSERDGRVERLALEWLLGIGRRVLADQRRAYHARRPPSKLPRRDAASLVAEPRARLVDIDGRSYRLSLVLRVLDECVNELSATSAPLMRDRMNGLLVREIAERHGISENRVKLRLHRGRRRLKQRMIERLREEEKHGLA